MTQRQEMHAHVQVEADLTVMDQVREIIVYQL
jgi:hypothetical protein